MKTAIAEQGNDTFSALEKGYSGTWLESNYGEVKQRWLLVRSEQTRKREQYTLDKRMFKESTASLKLFKKLTRERYACEFDANTSLKKGLKIQGHIDINDVEIIAHAIYKQSGRPKQDQQPDHDEYQISGQLHSSLTQREARYLKKPKRIESLLMIMTCCLMVYAALEHKIRQELKAQCVHFPDLKYKPTQNPTARKVFFRFQGLHVLTIHQEQEMVVNLQEKNKVIIDCMGSVYQKIYS